MSKGSCLCNAVKFNVSGQTSDMSHCHCSMCRKIHGAMFATYFKAEHVEYTAGQDAIVEYESSPGFPRSFCTHCGSPLPEKSQTQQGSYVPAGLMDDDPGVRPSSHIFVESKAPWHTITDELPQHQHYGDNNLERVVDVPTPAAKEGCVTGSCQCGDVAFEFTGKPSFMMNCHCSRCRKVKGAAHATNAFVPYENLTWTSGESNITNYAVPSAKFFGNAFCKTCGSSVPRARADKSVYNVPVGCLNQAPGVEAKGHIFVGSKAEWFDVTGELPTWDEMPG